MTATAAVVAAAPVAFLDMGIGELAVVAIVALLLFGGRLPEVMRTMGASYRKFRRAFEDLSRQALDPARDLTRQVYQPTPPASQPPSAAAPAPAPPATSGEAAPVAADAASTSRAAAAAPSATPSAAPPSRADDELPLV